jgi:hypothetical protein
MPMRQKPAIDHSLIHPVLLGVLGPVAQLGARLTGSQEVRGSNPLRSIENKRFRPPNGGLFLCLDGWVPRVPRGQAVAL